MTNYERIKNMSVEDLAIFITDLTNDCEYGCMYCNFYINGECSSEPYPNNYMQGCIDWLNSEAEK